MATGPGGMPAPTFADQVDPLDLSTDVGLFPEWFLATFGPWLHSRVVPTYRSAADRALKGGDSFTSSERALSILSDVNKVQYWNGATWVDAFDDSGWLTYTPPWFSVVPGQAPSGMTNGGTGALMSGRWRAFAGKRVSFSFRQEWGSAANVGQTNCEFYWKLPTPARTWHNAGFGAEIHHQAATQKIQPVFGRFVDSEYLAFRLNNGTRIGRGTPGNWQQGDYIDTCVIDYERA